MMHLVSLGISFDVDHLPCLHCFPHIEILFTIPSFVVVLQLFFMLNLGPLKQFENLRSYLGYFSIQ